MPQKVTINILSPNSLRNKEDGRKFLEFLVGSYAELSPQKYNYYEPIKLTFDGNKIGEAVDGWGEAFLWKRRKPKVDGNVWPSTGLIRNHGWIVIELDMDEVDQHRMDQFLKEASGLLDAHFASIHLLNPTEITQTRSNGTVYRLDPNKEIYSISITTHQLRKYVPNLYWATVFGEPYVNLVGRETMLTSPAPVVEELPYGGIYIQLSESIYDLQTNYEAVDRGRQAVKEHFGYNLFFEPDAFEDQTYDVPDFHLGEE